LGGRGDAMGRVTVRVGTAEGLLWMSWYWSRGVVWERKAIAARLSGSMEGRPKAGPQTWSSSTIAVSGGWCILIR